VLQIFKTEGERGEAKLFHTLKPHTHTLPHRTPKIDRERL
jgi:hypothetical protein